MRQVYFVAAMVAALTLTGCTKSDELRAKQKAHEAGQELKRDLDKAGHEIRQGAEKAKHELQKGMGDTDRRK
jgi:hypothetical protein